MTNLQMLIERLRAESSKATPTLNRILSIIETQAAALEEYAGLYKCNTCVKATIGRDAREVRAKVEAICAEGA